MEFIKTKCRKCGYEIVIPERTETVYCGSCGHINHYNKITSLLKKYSDAGEIDNPAGFPAEITRPAYKKIPGRGQESSETDIPSDDGTEFPEEKKASRILTIIFILAPFIAMAVEFFKLPSYAAVLIIIILAAVIVFTLKKK